MYAKVMFCLIPCYSMLGSLINVAFADLPKQLHVPIVASMERYVIKPFVAVVVVVAVEPQMPFVVVVAGEPLKKIQFQAGMRDSLQHDLVAEL